MTATMIALGDVFDVAAGGAAPQNPECFSTDGIPFVRAGSLVKLLGGKAEDSLERIAPESAKKHRLRLFPKDTILFAKSGMSALKGHIYQLKSPAYVVSHLAALIPSHKVNARYVHWALGVFSPTHLVKDPAYPSIRLPEIAQMKIPLPPLIEQGRIAGLLDHAHLQRQQASSVLSKLKALEASIFDTLFGDLRDFSHVPFGELVDSQRIGLVRGSDEFGEGKRFPYVRMDAIGRDGTIMMDTIQTTDASQTEADLYGLEDGDFLFNTRNSRELVGKTAVWRSGSGYLFNNNIMRIRFTPNVTSDFVQFAFSTPRVKQDIEIRKTGTTSVFAIYWRDLKTLPIPVPHPDLQATFSKHLAQTSALMRVSQERLGHLDSLFASLQHRAFRGAL